jgi:uncharacterized membrane protein YesL
LSLLIFFLAVFLVLPESLERIGFVLYTAFCLSIVVGMSYKIVPFLTWFHLNAQGYFSAPLMHEVIHPDYTKKHLWIHLSALLLALCATIWPVLWVFSGTMLALSFLWLALAVYRAWHIYLHIRETEERFDMNSL